MYEKSEGILPFRQRLMQPATPLILFVSPWTYVISSGEVVNLEAMLFPKDMLWDISKK